MYKPSATYRIQFHQEFTFKDLSKQVPYLANLGIDTLYASPIFTAVSGSTHGYDGVNPLEINPEIGTEAELFALVKKLKANGIGWLQDIVPNHMAFSTQNGWLMDVLKKWDRSHYFSFFDLNLLTTQEDKRLMVPFLGETLEDAISGKKLQLQLRRGEIFLTYGNEAWPTNEATLKFFPSQKINTQTLQKINKNLSLLQQIVDVQYYRLCHWQETEQQINYRRFFTVNGLICLKMEGHEVFDTYHRYIFELVQKGVFQGLRIDHVDGLADPKKYLQWLREAVGEDVYIVVEKILAADEKLPADWPVQGNTGYDFLAKVNNLFTNRAAEKSFTKLYQEVIEKQLEPAELVISKKRQILLEYMKGELDHLLALLLSLEVVPKDTPTLAIETAITDFLVYCPVYRFYGNELPLPEQQYNEIDSLLNKIPISTENKKGLVVLKEILSVLNDEKKGAKIFQFYQRCMQFTGPLMAKGVEDTLMYTYNRFMAHAEVGDAADAFGISISMFHFQMAERLQYSPFSLNATATHDTKRGEDVRARLNVLTDLPRDWEKLVRQLQRLSSSSSLKKLNLHRNDGYLIFQALLGVLSVEEAENEELDDRMMQYLEKALREAKKRTDWSSPNEDYEQAVKKFVGQLLDRGGKGYQLLRNFLAAINNFSIINSMSQLVLKFTCPGIPDIYQGTELWDLSLVDPDNRRQVNFELRAKWLKELGNSTNFQELWKERNSGKLKLWLLKQLLEIRTAHAELLHNGSYVPIKVTGKYKKHIIAFLRKGTNEDILVVVPLGLASISNNIDVNRGTFDWEDTELVLPASSYYQYENLLTKENGNIDVLNPRIRVNSVLNALPLGLLHFKANLIKRASGVLLPIFSLPGKSPIGQLGASAFKFAELLAAAHQRYWQLLPLNPVSSLQRYSPYSSYSAMAGNTLFIDLEEFQSKGWLNKEDLNLLTDLGKNKVDYEQADELQHTLLRKAHQGYIEKPLELEKLFSAFCEREDFWLHDFALYAVLRTKNKLLPWNKWPAEYKFRDKDAIQQFAEKFKAEILEIKWQQWIFHWQWERLKTECNKKGIQLIGDLPFYISYDSADVWANPELFKLNKQLEMEVVAGVPPDAFNADGQLWGLPIFDWKYLKSTNYKWWMERIKKNLDLFDLLRLDHFRAFHSYFEIDATATSAKGGVWIAGPGENFLKQVCTTFKELPFIVEDLGGNMEGPYQLRDQFKLAGMKVLQFAFDVKLPSSPNAPHQFHDTNTTVYPGTHDNNTIRGWYDTELDQTGKKRLAYYLGKKIKPSNVHQELIRMVLASNGNLAIIQAQDLLGLDSSSRMNTPATLEANWLWRMKNEELTTEIIDWLAKQVSIYGRW
jgi:malto-oligosyltrehalose synthase/4-alpha-glucanotransferase